MALSRYKEAWVELDEPDMDRWVREFQEVCCAVPVQQERKRMSKEFSSEDTIRAHSFGVLLQFPQVGGTL